MCLAESIVVHRLPSKIPTAQRARDARIIFFVADTTTMEHRDRPILCINLLASQQPFRVIPSELWAVENNLSLANMDYEEFSDAVDAEGIFRGFS